MRRVAPALLIWAFLPGSPIPAAVAQTDPSPAAIDSIFSRYDRTSVPGCALGVFRNDRIVSARGYGMADLNQGVPITPETVFYIASTSKQFTAMSIALLAEEGKLALTDPVRKWIPELPAYADRITIANLVHHTSGLRDYLGLWALSGRSVADEIPEEVALDLIRRQQALDFEPGSQYSYSNSGYFLLSQIVKRASGRSLRDYAEARIFGPLGMAHTQFHDDNTRIVPRRAEGYQPAGPGRFQIVRTSFALVGDGGLLTTIEDLLKWDANFFANRLGRGDQGLIDLVTTAPRASLADGTPQRYAFGLMPGTYRGLPVVEHGGSFIGFRAQLLRFPGEHFSVAILCNDYTAAPEQLARQVADRYLADRLAPVAGAVAGGTVRVAPDRLARWAGRYEVLPGIVATVAVETGALTLAVVGQPVPIAPSSDSTFLVAGGPDALEFAMDSAGPTLLARGFGMTEPVARLAPPVSLTPAAAARFAGRFVSEELDTWSVVEARGDTLRIRVRWDVWRPLEHVGPDRFIANGGRILFERDRTGRVTGFTVSQARTRNVRFRRAEGAPVRSLR
ncbi:MAG: serine hydrolase domain-containing protein [Gemmatimonadales bacterium]